MNARITGIRDVALLCMAVVAGAVLSPVAAFVGLPLAAAGIAGLTYRGHLMSAAIAAGVGTVAVGLVRPVDVAFVAPSLIAVVLAVILLRTHSLESVGSALVAVLALASAATDALLARASGTSLAASIAEQSQALAGEMAKAISASGAGNSLTVLEDAARTLASVWPAAYFQVAVFVGALVIAAIVWAARKADRPLDVPSISQLDLSPHVLWAFVAGLLLMAVSYGFPSAPIPYGVVGLNLVLCARTLFFLQGFSVVAGLLDRAGVGLGGRILALAALAALDALTLVVSFTGLLDFWINFRRLPREGATPTVAEPDGRRW